SICRFARKMPHGLDDAEIFHEVCHGVESAQAVPTENGAAQFGSKSNAVQIEQRANGVHLARLAPRTTAVYGALSCIRRMGARHDGPAHAKPASGLRLAHVYKNCAVIIGRLRAHPRPWCAISH